jgi:signal transduction histidine kinase
MDLGTRPSGELGSLSLIQQAITNRLDERAVLRLIADEARRLTNAQRCVVFLLEGAMLHIAAASGGEGEDDVTGQVLPLDGSLAEAAITSGQPVRTADAAADPHVTADPRRRALIERLGIETLLIAPLLIEGQAIGAISLSDRVGGPFGSADERLLGLMADQAALAIENARLRRQVEQAAVREERGRLARELHDSVTQSLYSLTLFAEATRHMAGEDSEQGRDALIDRITRIGEIAQQALKEMRLLVYELRPPALADEGLIRALRGRLEAVEGRAGIETRFVVGDLITLPPEVEAELYRIALEALNNALKHARASQVTVSLRCEDDRVALEIRDDGIGFDPAIGRESGGVGLRSMAERAARMGGTLDIDSTPGGGTAVTVRVRAEDEEDEG